MPVVLLLAWSGAGGWAQAPGELTGRELRPIQDIGSALTDLVLGGRGRLKSVVVTEDSERRLAVKVSYEGLAGRDLTAQALDDERKRVAGVSEGKVRLEAGAGEVVLALTLDEGAAEDTFTSGFVQLTVTRPGRAAPELIRVYPAVKGWRREIAPENLVLDVRLEPEGDAASLPVGGGPPPLLPLPPMRPLAVHAMQPVGTASPLELKPVTALRLQDSGGLTRKRAPGASPSPSPPPAPEHVSVAEPLVVSSTHRHESVLRPITGFHFGLPEDVAERGGGGPGMPPLNLLAMVRPSVDMQLDQVTRLWPEVFPDRRPDSGIFYFVPRAYHLEWNPDEGYGMRMLYQAATAEGEAGQVAISVRLTAGVDASETQLAEALLRAYAASHPGVKFTELRPLPLAHEPDVSISDDLGRQYDIPADRVTVHAISDALGEIVVSWVTDPVTKENLQLALVEDVGINGTVVLTPAGEAVGPLRVPLRIALADRATLGRPRWRRGEAWRNETPFPMRLRYVHALLVEGSDPIIYSWRPVGEGTTVLPRSQVRFDAARVPAWIGGGGDARVKRVWLDCVAPHDRDRDAYDRKLLASITGGVTSLGAYAITFKSLTPLADTGAAEIAVLVRSRYFDPQSREVRQKPAVAITEDGQEHGVGPVYLVNRQPGEEIPDDPLYEYRLSLVMPDGEEHEGSNWIAGSRLRVLIGTVQIRQSLGHVPGQPAGGEGGGGDGG